MNKLFESVDNLFSSDSNVISESEYDDLEIVSSQCTDGGYANNEITMYGKLSDGNYFWYIPDQGTGGMEIYILRGEPDGFVDALYGDDTSKSEELLNSYVADIISSGNLVDKMQELFDIKSKDFEKAQMSRYESSSLDEGSSTSEARVIDLDHTGGGVMTYFGEVGDYSFIGDIDGVLEFFDKSLGVPTSLSDYFDKVDYDFEQDNAKYLPDLHPAVAKALKDYADSSNLDDLYKQQIYDDAERLNGNE